MHIQIPVPARLNLLRGHEKLLVQLLVKLIEDQASLGGDKRAVRISVLLVPYVHDGLALLIHVVHHTYEILFIIAIVPITLGNDGFHILQRTLHHIVHDLDRNLLLPQLVNLIDHSLAYMALLFIREFGQRTISTLPYGVDDLLDIELLQTPILLDHLHDLIRLVLHPEILFCRSVCSKLTAH